MLYGEQDKSGENRSKCPVVGSIFPKGILLTVCVSAVAGLYVPHPLFSMYMYMYVIPYCPQLLHVHVHEYYT